MANAKDIARSQLVSEMNEEPEALKPQTLIVDGDLSAPDTIGR